MSGNTNAHFGADDLLGDDTPIVHGGGRDEEDENTRPALIYTDEEQEEEEETREDALVRPTLPSQTT